MVTKTMKYEIKYEKELYNLLSDIQYVIYRLKNKATSMTWDWQQYSFGYKERLGDYPKEKDMLGKTLSPDIYNQIKDEFGNFVSSSIVDVAIQEAVKKFKKDSPEILRGERSIANYKRDGAFPIRKAQIKNLNKVTSKRYTCKLSLLSREGVKEKGFSSGRVDVELRTGNGAYQILDRILEGSYKMCDSKITKVKNKFYLLLTYQFEAEKVEVDKNIIMGIDVGVVNPATIAVSNDNWYYQFVGNGNDLDRIRKQVEARKKRILESRKWAGEGSVGHGYRTRTKAVEKVYGKIANYRNTMNHNWSSYIIKEAVRLGAGVIQMEDISGINEKETFLKNWTYYDLQKKIEYKAKQFGIEVVKIKPAYTSQRCSKCGNIHKENRTKQDKFECKTCGFTVNADVNAARNIAIKDIEKIIEDQLKAQEKHMKHMMKYVEC